MDDSTKDFLIKVLLWGGGGLLALVLLVNLLETAFTILTFPFREPWAFIALGGIGYFIYRKFFQTEQSETEEIDQIDDDFHME